MLVLSLLTYLPTTATELIIPRVDGAPFANAQVPLTVIDFVGVAGLEIHVNYDTSKLILDSVGSPYLITSSHVAGSSYLIEPTSIINISIPGQIHVVWDDINYPLTLNNNQALMHMYFTVKGAASGSAEVGFGEGKTTELVSVYGNVFSTVLHEGGIDISSTDVDDNDEPIPSSYRLEQNYPNPFNPTTNILYSVDRVCEVELRVFNVTGQMVDKINLGRKQPGIEYVYQYSGAHLASGIYTYQIGNGISTLSRKMALVK